MRWKSERVFINTAEYMESLIAECDAAVESICMEFYIFEPDSVGTRVAESLVRASQRGVCTSLLVDGFGSAEWVYSQAKELSQKGVDVKIFHPLPLLFFFGPLANSIFSLIWLPYILKVNRRNHRKLCIIDKRIAYAGSQNIVLPHKKSTPAQGFWRETGVRVEGVAIAELELANERAWARSWGFTQKLRFPKLIQKTKPSASSGLVRINDTKAKRKALWRDFYKRIATAKKRVWITTAYFVPSRRLLRSLTQAAQNGVDVRILLPGKSDVTFIPWVSAALSYALLKANVKIFEYQANILHAKTILIDDWATVGSSNLNYRSLLHDLELDIVVQEKNSLCELESAFTMDLIQSHHISERDWKEKPWYTRLLGRLALNFKSYM